MRRIARALTRSGEMVPEVHVHRVSVRPTNPRMVSPVWYNIRRTGTGKYRIDGEHDVDQGWMREVRYETPGGQVMGRILPRFTADGWDKDAYEEIIKSESAKEEFTRMILEQITCRLHCVVRLIAGNTITTALSWNLRFPNI
jgi:hypothetical protein